MDTYDLCIVGAGLTGATIARLAAEDSKKVLVIDQRDHLGGNVYDTIDPISGIRINKYGAHIFHTNDEGVWKFVNRFSLWKRWEHHVLANISNTFIPVPITIPTINGLYNLHLHTKEDMEKWLSKERISCESPTNSEEMALSKVGSGIYEHIFKDYTKKQWDKYPNELDPSVLERIPIRADYDTRYFTDKYQAMPENGYTSLVESMLLHPNITIKLNTSWTRDLLKTWKLLVFTGPIDSYFNDIGLPKLEYRSIKFEWERFYHPGYYQPAAVINYPTLSSPYTRIVEYKHFLHQKSPWTILAKETTCADGEPYYPVPTQKNRDLYEKYKKQVETVTNVHFVGRLASYKYFNMDQAIRNAMDYYNTILRQNQDT